MALRPNKIKVLFVISIAHSGEELDSHGLTSKDTQFGYQGEQKIWEFIPDLQQELRLDLECPGCKRQGVCPGTFTCEAAESFWASSA